MNSLIDQVRQKIGLLVIDQLEDYFGDEKSQINKAIDLNLPILVRIISQYSSSKPSTTYLMNLINEGGHASDLFDELELVFSDYDKMQLLGTIGSNLNKVFYKENGQVLNYLVSNSAIKKSSAISLMNFMSPIALSVLGKNIKNMDWKIEELKSYLNDQIYLSESLIESNFLQNLDFLKEKSDNEIAEKSNNTNEILDIKPVAWIFTLLLLGLSIWYFLVKNENVEDDEPILNSLSVKEKKGKPKEEIIIGFEKNEGEN